MDCEDEMSKTTRKTYGAGFKMAVAMEAAKEQETLSQVAAKHGVSPSLAAAWRDELLAGADSIFGRTKGGAREEGAGGGRAEKVRRSPEDDRAAHRRARLPPEVLRQERIRPQGVRPPRATSPKGSRGGVHASCSA